MSLRIFLHFEKCLFLQFFLDLVWIFCESFSIYFKLYKLEKRTKYLAFTVYFLFVIVESVRLVLGTFGCVHKKIPELAGFLIVSMLMQLPLVSFFVFHGHLQNSPVEEALHTLLWISSIIGIILGIFSVRAASRLAKYMFLCNSECKLQKVV